MRVSSLKYYISNPLRVFRALAARGLFDWMSDEQFIKALYFTTFKKRLNLKNPRTFNEKIQWLKLYDHNPTYPEWVDKITAKKKVEEAIGKEYIIPLLYSWTNPSDIRFEELPEHCVLKCNHDQGSTIIIDKSKEIDETKIRDYFKEKLLKNAYRTTREWPYKKIKPQILCEPFIGRDVIDYKFFCFNGKPAFVNIGQKNSETHLMHITFLDFDWIKLQFQRKDFPPVSVLPEKPKKFDEMLKIASILSKGTTFVRIDLFCIDDNIYFSEFTLYPTSGLIEFSPEEGDYVLGGKIKLPELKEE